MLTEYVPTDEKIGPRYPLILTTGRILSQYNVGAQTRRTDNVLWHTEDRLEIHPHDAEERGVVDGDWVTVRSRAGETGLRALITERVAPGVVYTTFHHPLTRANVVTTDYLRLGDQLPRVQGDRGAGDALERPDRRAGGLRRLQRAQPPDRRPSGRGVARLRRRPPSRARAVRVSGGAQPRERAHASPRRRRSRSSTTARPTR